MGIICIILAVLITLFILMIGQYNDIKMNISLMSTGKVYEISSLVICLITYAFGILSGALLMLSQFFDVQKHYTRLKKQYEKTSLGQDDAEDKIKLLENKVATLEAALKSAMKK